MIEINIGNFQLRQITNPSSSPNPHKQMSKLDIHPRCFTVLYTHANHHKVKSKNQMHIGRAVIKNETPN
jgi:hypothetical protein